MVIDVLVWGWWYVGPVLGVEGTGRHCSVKVRLVHSKEIRLEVKCTATLVGSNQETSTMPIAIRKFKKDNMMILPAPVSHAEGYGLLID